MVTRPAGMSADYGNRWNEYVAIRTEMQGNKNITILPVHDSVTDQFEIPYLQDGCLLKTCGSYEVDIERERKKQNVGAVQAHA